MYQSTEEINAPSQHQAHALRPRSVYSNIVNILNSVCESASASKRVSLLEPPQRHWLATGSRSRSSHAFSLLFSSLYHCRAFSLLFFLREWVDGWEGRSYNGPSFHSNIELKSFCQCHHKHHHFQILLYFITVANILHPLVLFHVACEALLLLFLRRPYSTPRSHYLSPRCFTQSNISTNRQFPTINSVSNLCDLWEVRSTYFLFSFSISLLFYSLFLD